ncbi:protein of unknown function [Legionella micdadei]|uniref:Uncharacterized protein n=1 Tax=Legionella micdadei TaxID=451 RepID=A0A098GGW2_LEGMI|nr:protein of unknown function [Legionella micdadei]
MHIFKMVNQRYLLEEKRIIVVTLNNKGYCAFRDFSDGQDYKLRR